MTERLSDEQLRWIIDFPDSPLSERALGWKSMARELLELRTKLTADPVMLVADLYSLCEATTEETYDSDKEFNRGRYFEARRIAKAVMAAGATRR